MDYLDYSLLDKPLWMWASFFGVVLLLLLFDLGVLNRKDKEISVRESLKLSVFYVSIGLAFGGFVWHSLGSSAAQDYYTGFIIEKTLSLDNIFVISLVFSYFHIPRKYQHRVLFWGILGVILLRGLLIGIGAELVHQFEWVLYLFAAFLIYTGIKMIFGADEETDISDNKVLQFVQKRLHVTKELHGHKFFVRQRDTSGKMVRYATPLFLALVLIEAADIVFAVDSVPAIFSITTDEYIVYTSNVFAILGLRARYFALAAMLHRFEYLHYSLSVVLVFIGGKVFYPLLADGEKLSSGLSLAITLLLIGSGVVYSLRKTNKAEPK